MENTVGYVSFSIEGEFITERALHAFYEDNNLPLAIDILKSATVNDELSEAEHMELIMSILNGEKELRGNSSTDEYGVYDVETPDVKYNVTEHLTKMQKQLESLQQKLHFVETYLSDNDGYHKLIDIDDEYREYSDGETIFGTTPRDDINYLSPTAKKRMNMPPVNSSEVLTATYGGKGLLDDFLQHAKESKDDDYGWLEPDGTYHVVAWGDHSQFAMEYLKEHYPPHENKDLYWLETSDGSKKPIVAGDVLVYKLHWVLLDNPSQGFARPTYDTKYGYTKAQKEFLFDYYMARNKKDLAYDLYKEE